MNKSSVKGLLMLAGNLILVATGCTTVGTGKLVSSHEGYNEAVQLTTSREVLKNIVRARYADPLRFLTVSSINAQFSVAAGGEASVGGVGTGATVGGLTGTIGYSDSPTITFSPQSDAAFYKSFYSPMEILETIGIGFTYKAEGGEYIKLLAGAINGASDRDSSDLYQQRVEALLRLRKRGAFLQMMADWGRANDAAIPLSQITAEGYAIGISEGLYWISTEDGGGARLVKRRMVPALVLSNPDDPEVVQALRDLGVEPGREKYPFRPPEHARPGAEDRQSIWVSPRSVHDMVVLASLQVDVPEEHLGIVPPIERFRTSSDLGLPRHIRSSDQQPDVPYRVQHRGRWFYVDDSDVESRLFLDLLVTLYSSRLGSRGSSDAEPTLVLGVGG